ncbi:MAG: sensor histidine kinase [Flavobacteriaceae bacterium]
MRLTLLHMVAFGLFVVGPKGNSQEVSYYKQLADTTSQPALKLMALDSILSKEGKSNQDVFIKNSENYIEYAKQIDSIEAAARKAIGLGYTLTTLTKEPERMIRIIDELLARKYKIKDSFLLGSLYLKRGGANFRLDLEQATKDYAKALEAYGENDSIYIADAYLFSGQAYSNLGKFVPAGENYRKAYEYYEALKDYEYMVFAQQGITTMFSMNGFYEKAKEEREKNIQKLQELGLEHNLIPMYYNQALDYKKMGNKKLEEEYLLKAFEFLKDENNETGLFSSNIYVFSKMIDFYLDEGNLAEAQKYFLFVQEKHDPSIKDNIYVSHYDEIMARYHLAMGHFDEALVYSEQKLGLALSLKYDEDIIASQELLSEIYAARKDYKKALDYKTLATNKRDSIYNNATANSLAYYQTLYETEKKEREITAQNANIQLLEKDNQAAKRKLVYFSLGLLLIFGIVILYRNRLQLKNKKVLQEKYSQELLVSQEEERKRISKDLHDGLGQQLLLIKNIAVKNHDPETKKIAEDAIEEVRGISRDLHPFQLQELGITKAIEMTLSQIDENTNLFISSEIENIDHLFDKSQEVNLYRIVQESLNNIIKHAKAEATKITVKKNSNHVLLEIKDNGIGFDFSEKYGNLKSMGLKTLLERTKFLNGQMKVTSKKNSGTTLAFMFPTS